MYKTREQIREERQQLKTEYGELFDSVSAILFRNDPIGIAFDNPHTDEYDPETATILPKLKDCKSANDVLHVVYEEFVRWFGSPTAGLLEGYTRLAEELWQMLQPNRNA